MIRISTSLHSHLQNNYHYPYSRQSSVSFPSKHLSHPHPSFGSFKCLSLHQLAHKVCMHTCVSVCIHT